MVAMDFKVPVFSQSGAYEAEAFTFVVQHAVAITR